eukprot:328101_1
MSTVKNWIIFLYFLSTIYQKVIVKSDDCHIPTQTAIITIGNSTGEYYNNINQKQIICSPSSRCHILCNGVLGCQCSIINATKALQLDIYCEQSDSCQDMTIYCPFTSINACNIHTDMDLETPMNIYVPENNFMYGYLNIDSSNHFIIHSNCFNQHGIVISQNDIVYDGTSYICQSDECCPWYYGQIWCSGSPYCSFFCVNSVDSKCSNMYIDGSSANNGLFLLCDTEIANCSNTRVTCPDNGACSIYCVGDRSCSDMSINYYGRNINATVAIYCNNDEACINMDIYAPYVNYINLVCDPKNNDYNYKGICRNITINAENTNKLEIICRNNLACVGINVNANNAKFLSVSADSVSVSAWLDSVIIASNAEFVEITCQSGVIYHSACANSTYYLPSHFILNCNGYGCYNVGDFYFSQDVNTSISALNFNGCERCYSVLNCTTNLNVFCDDIMVCNWKDKTETIKGLVDNVASNCGCNELYHNTKISFISNDSFCSVMLEEKEKIKHESWLVHIIVGIICGPVVLICMYLMFLYIRKRFYLSRLEVNISLNENSEQESDKESDSNPHMDETMMERCQI